MGYRKQVTLKHILIVLRKGNPVRFRYCPATVKGVRAVVCHCLQGREGTVIEKPQVRKPAQDINSEERLHAKVFFITRIN